MSNNESTQSNDQNEQVNQNIALDFTELQNKAFNQVRDYLIRDINNVPKKYSKEQIRKYYTNPKNFEKQLREVSRYFYVSSNHYMRLINYFGSMLTLDNFLRPLLYNKENFDKESFMRSYNKSEKYIENYNIKHEFGKITAILVSEGVFFGYERRSGNNLVIQRMPSDYCRISGIEDGIYTYELNMKFFDQRNIDINNYSDEIQLLFRRYQVSNKQWQEVSSENGVCFVFDEEVPYNIPPFSGIFEEILDIVEAKELLKDKDKLENFKLIHQKIPFKKDPRSEKDFLLSLDSVGMFHKNIKSVLPSSIGLVSSPMEIGGITLEKKKDVIGSGFAQAEESLYDSSGVSKGLFNSKNNNAMSLGKGITVDEGMMFKLLRQFERFLKKRLSGASSKQYPFKVVIPDLTIYNRKEKFDQYLKAAQYGFPKSYVAASMGSSLSEVNDMNFFENEILDMSENMIPVSSSHTSSEQNGGGRPMKEESELTPNGEKTRANDGNNLGS